MGIDYVKSLPDVDSSRVAITGNSLGALLTLMVGVEQKGIESSCHNGPRIGWAEFIHDVVPSLFA